MTKTFQPGDVVGSKRWPYQAAHPDCWQKPLQGVVLQQDDPRVWAGSFAFPVAKPNRAKVKAHVARCRAEGLLREIPVLWTCPRRDGVELKVWWESPEGLRSYEDDCAEWETARDNERARYEGSKKAA
jgi:hypothetical protein